MVQIRKPAPDVPVLEIHGDLDIDTVPTVRQAVEGLLGQGAARLVFDFSKGYYVDSSGISLLLQVWTRLNADGGRMAVICTVPRIRRVFSIVNLDDVLPIVDTEEQALAALDGPARARYGR